MPMIPLYKPYLKVNMVMEVNIAIMWILCLKQCDSPFEKSRLCSCSLLKRVQKGVRKIKFCICKKVY